MVEMFNVENYDVISHAGLQPSFHEGKHDRAFVKESITKRVLMIVSTPYVVQARISYFLAMTVLASHAFLPFRNSLSPILHSRANIARRHQPNVRREFGRRLNPQFTWNSNNHPPKGRIRLSFFFSIIRNSISARAY